MKNKVNSRIKLRGSSYGDRLSSSGRICGSGRGLGSAGITGSSGSWGGISSWSSRNVGMEGRNTGNLRHFGSKGIGAGVIKASVGGYKRRRIGGIDTSQNWCRIKRVRGIGRGLEFVTIIGVMSICDCPDPT